MLTNSSNDMELCSPSEEEALQLEALKVELNADFSSSSEQWPGFLEVTGDVRLLRFLRGQDGNVKKAAKQFRKHLQWRKDHGVDAIRQEIVEKCLTMRWDDVPRGDELRKYLPAVLDAGRSKDFDNGNGHHVYVENVGLIDADAILDLDKGIGVEAFIQSWIYVLEMRNLLLDTRSRESGCMARTIMVRDMGQVGMHMLNGRNIKFMQLMLKLVVDNYPENLGKIIFTNGGSVLSAGMKMMRPFLHPKIVEKFVILPPQKGGIGPLLEQLQPTLPVRPTLHSACWLSRIAQAKASGEIGEYGDVVNSETKSSCRSGILYVPARVTADVDANVCRDQTVQWEWYVEGSEKDDTEWCTVRYFTDDGWSDDTLVSTASKNGFGGSYHATRDGILVLLWDNTRSMLRTKTVHYEIQMELKDVRGGDDGNESKNVDTSGDDESEPSPAPEA